MAADLSASGKRPFTWCRVFSLATTFLIMAARLRRRGHLMSLFTSSGVISIIYTSKIASGLKSAIDFDPSDLIAKALWIVFKSKLGRTLVFILLYSTNFRSLIDESASMSSGYRIITRKSSTLILKPAFSLPVDQFTCRGNNRPSESDIQISLKFNDRIESRVL